MLRRTWEKSKMTTQWLVDSGIPRIDYSLYYRSPHNLLCTTGTHQALIGRTLSVIFPTIFWDEDVRPIVDNT